MRRVVGSVAVSVVVLTIALAISRYVAWRAGTSFFAGTSGRFLVLKLSPEVGLWHAYPPWGRGDLQLAVWRIDGCDGVGCDFGPQLFLSATGRIVGATPPSLATDLEDQRARARDEAQGDLVRLAPGSEVELRLVSDGCFGSSEAVYLFSRDTGGEARVEVLSETMGAPDRRVPRGQRLTERDVLDLDRELRAARRPSHNGCTNTRTFALTVREGSRIVREDHFVDGACTDMSLRENALTLGRL